MKKLLFALLILAAPLSAPAEPRPFNQAELDALVAPIALFPDALLHQVLEAANYPGQVAQATRWSKSNGNLSGDAAVAEAQGQGWHPAVTALTAFPDLLQRMDENPQWLRDLGDAWRGNATLVMDTVQQLRRRADTAGNLRNDGQQEVTRRGDEILISPVSPAYVFAPYYSPLVVFGTWWWTTYRPIVWRPWIVRPVVWHWYVGPVVVRPHPRPIPVSPGGPHHPHVHRVIHVNGPPSPAARMQAQQAAAYLERQRALNQPSPAARYQLAQAQAVARPAAVVHPAVVHTAARSTPRAQPQRPLAHR